MMVAFLYTMIIEPVQWQYTEYSFLSCGNWMHILTLPKTLWVALGKIMIMYLTASGPLPVEQKL